MSRALRRHYDQFEEYPVLIPEGEYRLNFVASRFANRFNRGALELHFRVGEMTSPHYGKPLVRYYKVEVSPKKRSFRAAPRSDFAREFALLFGIHPDFRQAPIEHFRLTQIVGRVATVTEDYRQRRLPTSLRYSSVRELLRLVE